YQLNGEEKYTYDFILDHHDGWGQGRPIFFAAEPQVLVESVHQQAEPVPPLKADSLLPAVSQQLISQQVGSVLVSGKMDNQDYQNMVSFFTGRGLPVKAVTTGISGDGGALIQGDIERGMVWNLHHEVIHTYTSMSLGVAPRHRGRGQLDARLLVGRYRRECARQHAGRQRLHRRLAGVRRRVRHHGLLHDVPTSLRPRRVATRRSRA
ncbi:MAG: hypothetical protein IPO67_24510, partial [Deltaproteobacteria bacterium]|nr:hypothetical protein [Deltaproteobacteria bacterium]